MKSNSNSIGLEYNINKGNTENQILDEELDSSLFDQKIELATDGLEPYYLDHLKKRISRENSIIIARYNTVHANRDKSFRQSRLVINSE
jgi:hypothetical protein